MATAAEKEELRGNIESEYNGLRDEIEKQYIADKEALATQYHEDIQSNAEDKRGAFIAAGLNSDGSDPQGRPQG